MKNDTPNIIFNDKNLLVFNKPSGLLSIRDHRHPDEKTIIDIACEYLKVREVYPVHRIDKGASGILIITKTPYAQKKMSDIIYRRQMRKIYLALVTGEVEKDGKIDLPILRTKSGKVRIDQKGKPAFTIYRVRERYKGYTLLEVEPKTGRMINDNYNSLLTTIIFPCFSVQYYCCF
ncbi:MAG: RNA pseudouridine synthase [Candidatus Firestonebacteria bacterium]